MVGVVDRHHETAVAGQPAGAGRHLLFHQIGMIGSGGGQTCPYVLGAHLSACPCRLLLVGMALPGLVVGVFLDALAVHLHGDPVEAVTAFPVATKAVGRAAVIEHKPAVSFAGLVVGEAVTVDTAIGTDPETLFKGFKPGLGQRVGKVAFDAVHPNLHLPEPTLGRTGRSRAG